MSRDKNRDERAPWEDDEDANEALGMEALKGMAGKKPKGNRLKEAAATEEEDSEVDGDAGNVKGAGGARSAGGGKSAGDGEKEENKRKKKSTKKKIEKEEDDEEIEDDEVEEVVHEAARDAKKGATKHRWAPRIGYRWLMGNIGFFLFLAALAVVYIYNGHYADKIVRDINRTNKELKELQYEYKTLRSEVMFRSKQSELARAVEPFGLRELMQPPMVIVDSTK